MNYKYILTAVLIVAVFSGTASAWLSGYDHRMAITVENGEASVLIDYQFSFMNDTNILVAAGHMQANGADCRITDSLDNLIPFWNETAFNTMNTTIWANATLEVGSNMFYMYYGNSGASDITNGTTTFPFFDDFNRANLIDAIGNPWSRYGGNPILSKNATTDTWDYHFVYSPYIATYANGTAYQDAGGNYYMYYGASGNADGRPINDDRAGLALSTDLYNWTRADTVISGTGHVGLVLDFGADGTFDDSDVQLGTVTYNNSEFHCWYIGNDNSADDNTAIGYANSTDGKNWIKHSGNPILNNGPGDDDEDLYDPMVVYDPDTDTWKMWYIGERLASSPDYGVMYATAPGNEPWNMARYQDNYVYTHTSSTNMMSPYVWRESATEYNMIYSNYDISGGGAGLPYVYHWAQSTNGINWTHQGVIFEEGTTGQWDAKFMVFISQINVSGTWYSYYRGTDASDEHRIGVATGSTRLPTPANNKWDTEGTISLDGGYAKMDPTETQRLKGKSNYGANYNLRYRADLRNDTTDQRAMGWIDLPMAWTEYMLYVPRTDMVSWSNGGGGGGDISHNCTPGFKTHDLIRNGTTSMIWKEDGAETASATTPAHIISANMMPYFYVYINDSNQLWIDWTLVRKYTATEPTSQLGAAETQTGGAYNIVLLPGWSIIGWTDSTDRTAHYMGGLIGSNCTYVTTRNSTTGAYESHNMAAPDENNFAIERGWGYFVCTTAETLWERDA